MGLPSPTSSSTWLETENIEAFSRDSFFFSETNKQKNPIEMQFIDITFTYLRYTIQWILKSCETSPIT